MVKALRIFCSILLTSIIIFAVYDLFFQEGAFFQLLLGLVKQIFDLVVALLSKLSRKLYRFNFFT